MKYFKAILLTSLLHLMAFNAFAEEDSDSSRRHWYNIGYGVGTVFNHYDPALATHISFNLTLIKNLFLTLETTYLFRNKDTNAKVHDAGVLLGYRSKKPNWYWSGAVGLAYYEWEKRYSGNWGSSWSLEKTGIAVPVEGQLFWTPVKHFGLGLIAHAMVGGDSYGALLLGFRIS